MMGGNMTPPVGRFAPTPSGRMHLGNVFAALIAWLSVRSRGGSLMLRMEDLDTQRTSKEFAQVLREDLLWLGLDWDVETEPQSQRSAVYEKYFDILAQKGLLYPCYCTRSQLHSVNAPHLADGTYVYPGTCRDLTEAQRTAFTRSPAWRVKVPDRIWMYRIWGRGCTRRILPPIAAILWCAGPMAYLSISWQSPWTTGKLASRKWCGAWIY